MHLYVCWFLGCLVPGPSPFSSGNTGPFLTCGWWRLLKAGTTFSPARFGLLRLSLSDLRAVVKRTSPTTVLRKITPLWFWFRWALSVRSFSVHTCFRKQLVSRWCYAAEVLVPFVVWIENRPKGLLQWDNSVLLFHIESSTGYKSKYDMCLKYWSYLPKCLSWTACGRKAVSLDCCVLGSDTQAVCSSVILFKYLAAFASQLLS